MLYCLLCVVVTVYYTQYINLLLGMFNKYSTVYIICTLISMELSFKIFKIP